MSEYTQGVCEDGAAILKDGQPVTIEQILVAFRTVDEIKDWDVNNKMKQGQFLLPQNLRKKIQQITDVSHSN